MSAMIAKWLDLHATIMLDQMVDIGCTLVSMVRTTRLNNRLVDLLDVGRRRRRRSTRIGVECTRQRLRLFQFLVILVDAGLLIGVEPAGQRLQFPNGSSFGMGALK